MTSWVKLHRSTLDSSIMQDDWHFRLFAWCLLKANYRPVSFHGTTIEPGQFVTGRMTGADALNVSPSKFYRGLETLRDKYQSIRIDTNNKWTTITICNWDSYQSKDDENDGEVNSSWTTNEQRMNNQRTTNEHNQRSKEFKNKESSLLAIESADKFLQSEEASPIDQLRVLVATNVPIGKFVEIWSALPAKLQTGEVGIWKQHWPDVVETVMKKHGMDCDAAQEHILQRVRMFAQSDKGKREEFQWSSKTFFTGGHFDDPVKSWEISDDGNRKAGRNSQKGTRRVQHEQSNEINDQLATLLGRP